MDANQLKNFKKWVKFCKKEGFSQAKCGDYEFSTVEIAKKTKKTTKSDKIEGLVHDPGAAMPPDSEMLYYSTDTFDSIRNSRKDPTPRN
jgi:hypothetical protein